MTKDVKNNRDLFFKLSFMYFIMHIFRIFNIQEEIDEILPTEIITYEKKDKMKLIHNFFDYSVLTKTEKILLFEFKKKALQKKDLKQVFNYYIRMLCKEKSDIESYILVMSKKSRIKNYDWFNLNFKPTIIQTKDYNKQKDLNKIRNKIQNRKKLTPFECSLLATMPIYELKESETEIVKEICQIIQKNKDLIPEKELDGLIMAMYLNIDEYINEEEKNKYMEMINMIDKSKGLITGIKNEGRTEERESIILKLLENFSIDEISKFLQMSIPEIENIIKK